MPSMVQILKRISQVVIAYLIFQNFAVADTITTDEVINREQLAFEKQRVSQILSERQLRNQLLAMGVKPADIQKRLDNMIEQEMKNQEIATFSEDIEYIDEWPIDSAMVGAFVVVFLVLLFSGFLAYSARFPFLKRSTK